VRARSLTNDSGGAVVSGQVVKMQNVLGIALVDIATSAVGAVAMSGVFTVPKALSVSAVRARSFNPLRR